MDNVWESSARHRAHALASAPLQQRKSAGRFALARFPAARKPVGRIEQRNSRNAFGYAAQNFKCDAAAHRMPRNRETLRRATSATCAIFSSESLEP